MVCAVYHFTICTTYGSTIWIDKLLKEQNAIVKSHKEDWDRQTRKEYKEKGRKKKWQSCFCAALQFRHLAFLNIYHMRASLDFYFHLAYPSTLPVHGLCDGCIQEIVEPEKNFLKVALFVSFFPQIIQGPIAIYDKLADSFTRDIPSGLKICKGCASGALGVIKKLVIADRAVNIINFVMDKPMDFSGTYVFLRQ
ncbi:MAG: hypothetical protein ACLRI8_07925 [Agathobacter rectalis]